MTIKTNDEARKLIADAGITRENITEEQLILLWVELDKKLQDSKNYNNTYRMNARINTYYMTCRTHQWENREAISFNRDGFIGFAGWADSNNIRPILDGVESWLNKLS